MPWRAEQPKAVATDRSSGRRAVAGAMTRMTRRHDDQDQSSIGNMFTTNLLYKLRLHYMYTSQDDNLLYMYMVQQLC